MDWKSGGAMEVAALGRPFSLRMLYDCRKDSLIPGKTLHIKVLDTSQVNFGYLGSYVKTSGGIPELFFRPLLENDVTIIKTVYLCNHKVYLNNSCVIMKGTLVRFVQMCKFQYIWQLEGDDQKPPSLSIEGKGSLKMEDKDKENVDKFSCRFFGDFCLQKTPTSFQDAVKVYQSLPISIRLVQEAQTVLEDFSELEMRCNDALRTTTALQFPQIGKKIKSLKEMCSKFKLEFQQTLAKKLPSIRGGGEEESELAEILKKTNSSPFSREHLDEWMDCKEREISILKSFNKMMKNTKTVPSQNDLDEELVRAEHAVCFVFTSLGSDESYLSALSNYLKGTTKPEELQDPHTCNVEKEQRYLSKETTDDMRKKAKRFSDFSETNTENKNTKFLMVGLTNETQKGSSIYLYKDGISVTENFEPPSKPETEAKHRVHVQMQSSDLSRRRAGQCIDEDQSRSQGHSQMSEVTVYKINHQEGFKIEYSLTIIDTPGFGSTRGIKRDKLITEQLCNLFSADDVVTEIDAVCFVVPPAFTQLTSSQKYVFDSVLSIFGKDVAENIRILVTFADGQQPPVLSKLQVSHVLKQMTDCQFTSNSIIQRCLQTTNYTCGAHRCCAAHYTCAVTDSTGDDEDGGFNQMVWNMGTKSMRKFFDALNVIETKSLTLTTEVIRERQQLEDLVESLQEQIRVGFAKLETISETKQKLKDHEMEITKNENLKIEVTVMKPYKKEISGTGRLINCQ
uniref:Uncharacterized protein n=1 Tax=Stegastes partitus TaxID=144197 RepID=A0A3B4ZY90_9TELE